jgi:hypothetical protein
MRVNKSQLEAMIRESVKEEIGNLNEEELQELLGGLRGLAGGAANAAKRAGGAIAGAARGAGQAVAGAASNAAGAVKGAYQAGEKQAAITAVKKGIQNVVKTIDQALQKVGNDPNAQHDLENVKAAVTSAETALTESKNLKTLRRKTK